MNFKDKANLIWSVADLLRGTYKQSDYGKVILPLTVLRRLDCVLAPTKQAVLEYLPQIKSSATDSTIDFILNNKAGHNFHNRSQYDFARLKDDPDNIAANLRAYIAGFSASAREIIEYFNFDAQIDRMDNPLEDILLQVVMRFAEIDLSDMDSMEMGYVFEELIRRFSEQSNETAGEHFTPREVIKLMVNVLFISDDDILTQEGIVKTLYDPACGTGGMLSVAEKHLKEFNHQAKLEVFGQEINPESYAICKADMLIKGQKPDNIKFGNSFTVDGLQDEKFDYMLSNPPFGVDWKKAQNVIKREHDNRGFAGRFGAGLPRINDGALLFLQHMIAKMKPTGTRIGIVFNGSPLFTGQAGSGESNIRQWIIENDWLEAIIALPDQLFYNTGISTYIWIVSNHKSPERKGKIQLINATGAKDDELIAEGKRDINRFYQKMTRSLGNKRKMIPENGNDRGIGFITKLYGDFEENEFVKIYPNDYFGYWRITVEQPQRDDNGTIITDRKGNPKADTALRDYENIPFLRKTVETPKLGVSANHRRFGLHGVETPNLGVSTQHLASLQPQTIEEYFQREVTPHLPDAWIDHSKTKIGYEINFTKYFYEFKKLRSLEEIKADILALEEETADLEKGILL
jgi:type I restriction enzyme M protein